MFVFWGSCCSDSGWVSICLWEAVSNSLCATSLFFLLFFFHFVNNFYLSTQVFSFFLFLFSPASLCAQVKKQASLWVLSCWPGSTHNTNLLLCLLSKPRVPNKSQESAPRSMYWRKKGEKKGQQQFCHGLLLLLLLMLLLKNPTTLGRTEFQK